MKAWLVRVKDEFYSTVVFAETRVKAKTAALSTECCEYAKYIDIEARREPQMDEYYTDGKTEMDWNNPQDRIALVKECGFRCEYDCDTVQCPAAEWCDNYEKRGE